MSSSGPTSKQLLCSRLNMADSIGRIAEGERRMSKGSDFAPIPRVSLEEWNSTCVSYIVDTYAFSINSNDNLMPLSLPGVSQSIHRRSLSAAKVPVQGLGQ